MHYVILRDDDTCALTPAAGLDRLYRPFLERALPVNLAAIPEVRTDVRMANGALEGFLAAATPARGALAPLADNRELVDYLKSEPGYRIVQHGCHHDLFEFDGSDAAALAARLERGAASLAQAGFGRPATFVAPYDRISRTAWRELAARFDVVSTGWFEARRLPRRWWPAFALKKLSGRRHWRAGGTTLLGHPGCLLSFQRPLPDMLPSVQRAVLGSRLTVLVTHWWEYYRDGTVDEPLIAQLHATAAWLASRPEVRVVSFSDVAEGRVPLN